MALTNWLADEHTTASPLYTDVAQEPLHHVEPRGTGGCEVHVATRVLCQLRLHLWMLVRNVVVADQVRGLVPGRLAFNLAQLAPGDDLTVEHVKCGKQRGRAVGLGILIIGKKIAFSAEKHEAVRWDAHGCLATD